MIRYLTAGESHGKALLTIIEGIPSNLEVSSEYINFHLARRQLGYGRGARMNIEQDRAEILSGIRFNKTLGSPISLKIDNKDWKNWKEIMSVEKIEKAIQAISIPRPGHADLVGTLKYNYADIRNSIERSSARETAARVAASTIARKLLEEFGIFIGSYVESIGGIYSENSFTKKLFKNKLSPKFTAWNLSEEADKSCVRVLDNKQEEEIIKRIDQVKDNGNTLGGTFYLVATGVPVGLGSFVHYDRKINAAIASDIMSINAVKGIEVGAGFLSTEKTGSDLHDEIIVKNKKITRKTNRAGGIEGGITNGMPIIVRVAMKPIATLNLPLGSVELANMQKILSRKERSDFTAVPACAVVAEAVLAFTISKFFVEKFAGDSVEEIKENYKNYNKNVYKKVEHNFNKNFARIL